MDQYQHHNGHIVTPRNRYPFGNNVIYQSAATSRTGPGITNSNLNTARYDYRYNQSSPEAQPLHQPYPLTTNPSTKHHPPSFHTPPPNVITPSTPTPRPPPAKAPSPLSPPRANRRRPRTPDTDKDHNPQTSSPLKTWGEVVGKWKPAAKSSYIPSRSRTPTLNAAGGRRASSPESYRRGRGSSTNRGRHPTRGCRY